jgi:hypothetical protein
VPPGAQQIWSQTHSRTSSGGGSNLLNSSGSAAPIQVGFFGLLTGPVFVVAPESHQLGMAWTLQAFMFVLLSWDARPIDKTLQHRWNTHHHRPECGLGSKGTEP